MPTKFRSFTSYFEIKNDVSSCKRSDDLVDKLRTIDVHLYVQNPGRGVCKMGSDGPTKASQLTPDILLEIGHKAKLSTAPQSPLLPR